MKSLSKTVSLLIFATVLTVILGGAYAFFFVVMKNKTEATAELFAKSEEISGKELRLTTALSTIKDEQENIEKLSVYFLKESEIVPFTKKIELLGGQSETSLLIEALEPGVGANNVAILNFRIVATGEFKNIMRLMGLLENFPAKFEWRSVRLTRGETVTEKTSPRGGEVNPTKVLPEWKVTISLMALNFLNE